MVMILMMMVMAMVMVIGSGAQPAKQNLDVRCRNALIATRCIAMSATVTPV
jgi:hypothetical protein